MSVPVYLQTEGKGIMKMVFKELELLQQHLVILDESFVRMSKADERETVLV